MDEAASRLYRRASPPSNLEVGSQSNYNETANPGVPRCVYTTCCGRKERPETVSLVSWIELHLQVCEASVLLEGEGSADE